MLISSKILEWTRRQISYECLRKNLLLVMMELNLFVFHKAANQEKSFDPFYLYFSQAYEKAYGKYKEIIAGILVHCSWLTQRRQMNWNMQCLSPPKMLYWLVVTGRLKVHFPRYAIGHPCLNLCHLCLCLSINGSNINRERLLWHL